MAYELIERVEAGAAGVASVTFSSIPQDGNDLFLLVSARTTSTSPRSIRATVAGDTGANYTWHRLESDSGGLSVSDVTTNYFFFGQDNSSDSLADSFGNTGIYIANYTKSGDIAAWSDTLSVDTGSDWELGIYGNRYTGTNAITSLNVFVSAGVWSQYSSFSLYKVTAT